MDSPTRLEDSLRRGYAAARSSRPAIRKLAYEPLIRRIATALAVFVALLVGGTVGYTHRGLAFS